MDQRIAASAKQVEIVKKALEPVCSAVLLAEQPMHQGSVQHGPLVLVSDLRKFPCLLYTSRCV